MEAGPMDQLMDHLIASRVAVGPQTGRKVSTLQTRPACDLQENAADIVGSAIGFSLHAGVAAKAHGRAKPERLQGARITGKCSANPKSGTRTNLPTHVLPKAPIQGRVFPRVPVVCSLEVSNDGVLIG